MVWTFGALVFDAGPSLHPYKPWKPSLFYRLCHPFTWRKTQTAALALLPKSSYQLNFILSGSGPTTPPLAIPPHPRRQPF